MTDHTTLKYPCDVKTPKYTGPRFTVWRGEFTHPDGTVAPREWVDAGNAVALLPVIEEDGARYMILARQPREVIGEDVLSLCAGVIDPDETARQAVMREAQEELGLDVHGITEVATYYSSEGFTNEETTIFYTEDVSFRGGGPTDLEERVDLVKVPIELLPDTIRKANNAKLIIALQWLYANEMDSMMDGVLAQLDEIKDSAQQILNSVVKI